VGIDPTKPGFNPDAFHQAAVQRSLQMAGQLPQLPPPQLSQLPDPAIFRQQMDALNQITGNLGILPQFITLLQNIAASSAATASKPPVVVNQQAASPAPSAAAAARKMAGL